MVHVSWVHANIPVTIQVDSGTSPVAFKPIWRFFGADEPNYAYMKFGRELLGELGELKRGEVFFRAHNMMSSGDGTPGLKWGSTNMYREDASGKVIYDWTIVDRIIDAYLKNGVKPLIEVGFMPEALSVKPEPYQHKWNPRVNYNALFTGWAYPPKNWLKWEELVFQWASHCRDKYGMQEVLSWYWQTWNEPNIGYWQGTREEFLKLNDYTVQAIRRAIPAAKIGGPSSAGGAGGNFLKRFLDHSLEGINYANGGIGTPLDFVSFHAKGSPKQINKRVQMGLANQLKDIDSGFSTIAKFPQLKTVPILITESDPEGCAACKGEHLSYRNGTLYSSYTAASFPRKLDLAVKHGLNLEGALTWAFEFEDQPYFEGFRSLATNGINKPVLNVFRIFSKMKGESLKVKSSAEVSLDDIVKSGVMGAADVSARAVKDNNRVSILLWHYHDRDETEPAAKINLELTGMPQRVPKVKSYLIDKKHSNSYTVWLAMGKPQKPSQDQIQKLEKASQLSEVNLNIKFQKQKDKLSAELILARQGVMLLELDF